VGSTIELSPVDVVCREASEMANMRQGCGGVFWSQASEQPPATALCRLYRRMGISRSIRQVSYRQ
jgi:hypothetical protein